MDINFDHVMFRQFQTETISIDNFIQLLYCAPQYFGENETVTEIMLNETVTFLKIMFDTLHKHTTSLKYYVLQHKQSSDDNDYINLKKVFRIIQQLKNDACMITERSQNVLKSFQKASDVFKTLDNMKPKGMAGHVEETKLKVKMMTILRLLNSKERNIRNVDFSDKLEDPKMYIEQESKLLEEQKRKALQDLASYTKEIKSNASKKLMDINQRSKAEHSKHVNNWVVKDKGYDKDKSKVKMTSSQKLHFHKQSFQISLEEKAIAWQDRIKNCKLHHEKEIAKCKIEIEELKQQHEQQYREDHDKLKRTLEAIKEANLKEYQCKIEVYNLQCQNQISGLQSRRRFLNHDQHKSKASEREKALVAKKKSTDKAEKEKRMADDQAEKIFEDQCKNALKARQIEISKLDNQLKSLIINSEHSMSKSMLQIKMQWKECENKMQAIFNQKCKMVEEITKTLLFSIEIKKSTEYKQVNKGIEAIDVTVSNESDDSIKKANEIICKFEEELREKEEAITADTKRIHLQNLFQSMKVQLEYVEHRKLEQIQLSKALSISCFYVNYAIPNIESYLYTTNFFWKEISSVTSALLKHTVLQNFAALEGMNKITEKSKLKIDQKSTTFKGAVNEFFVECSTFVGEFSLIDDIAVTAKQNILKLDS